MGRAFWFAAGAGVAVYGSVKARRLAYRLSLPGLGDQAAALRVGADALVDDIRAARHKREEQLLDALGLAQPTSPTRPPTRTGSVVPLPSRAADKDTG